MKDFIEQYKILMLKADRYVIGILNLQYEFEIDLEIGKYELLCSAVGLEVDKDNLYIRVCKTSYEYSDEYILIVMPECVDTRLLELRKYAESKVARLQAAQEEQERAKRQQQEEKEWFEYQKLKQKFENNTKLEDLL